VRIHLQFSLLLAISLLLTGCYTVPNRYIPNAVGSLNNEDKSNSLRASIELANPESFIGEPIVFQVVVKNIGKMSLWIPSDPEFFFTWIYPDGHRDSFVYEPQRDQFYSREDAVCLRPGQQLMKPVAIRTHYFQQNGVTEFRAYLRAGRNTNPELNPFLDGELASNSYGVMVLGARKRGDTPNTLTKNDIPPSPTS
jgi:hypothetical protein